MRLPPFLRNSVYRWRCRRLHGPESPPLLACFTHHKTGTVLFTEVLRDLSQALSLRFHDGPQEDLRADDDVWVENHSAVHFRGLHRPYRGVHVIRDPRDMIVSGYRYHLRCREPWCLEPQGRLGGRSYQEYLRALSPEEGILAEMERARHDLGEIQAWDFANPMVLEVKLEDVLGRFQQEFSRIFRFYGFDEEGVEQALQVARKHDINGFSEERIRDDPHIHSPGIHKWRGVFSDTHRARFKELFPGLLARLGYERNESW